MKTGFSYGLYSIGKNKPWASAYPFSATDCENFYCVKWIVVNMYDDIFVSCIPTQIVKFYSL